MAKLYFRYGTVGSAKTLNLLAVAHTYESQGKNVIVIKPKVDTRFGEHLVKSRAGLQRNADYTVGDHDIIPPAALKNCNCLLVDEAQFLAPIFIDHLRSISINYDIPVICYGLRTDFKTNFFDGSKRLMEVSDLIQEIKNTCFFCDNKGIYNIKKVNEQFTFEGPQIELGSEETYLPCCASCYNSKKHEYTSKPNELNSYLPNMAKETSI